MLAKLLSLLLLPLSYLYCAVMFIRFKTKRPVDFGVSVVSVGNLSVGGSGKTPLVSALAKRYEKSAVVLRGYGRSSSGLFVVSDGKGLLVDVKTSGDEAMVYAHKLPQSVVIVSEDRALGIQKAKELGCEIVFLDDAYSKHDIKKLDFIIDVESQNSACLPAGPFRERLWSGKKATVLHDGVEFRRVVELKNKTDKMSLVTAIARAQRLDAYLPEVVSKTYFEDHHAFVKDEVEMILKQDASDSLLVTYKDFVKLEGFGLPLSLLDLEMVVDESVFEMINNYRRR